jgi:GR25 family glycosyltransferase involved in LPS biosynthesis
MKFHIIRIEDTNCPAHEASVAAADRCTDSLKKYGVEYDFFPAYTPNDEYVKEMMHDARFMRGFRGADRYARMDRCVAAHLSHRTLWEMCQDANTGGDPIGILEHDAIMVRDMPNYLSFQYIVNLGKPSYGKFKTVKTSGVHRLFSKPHFPGTHAYAITPLGANKILNDSKGIGGPVDTFLSSTNFRYLEEHSPWIFEADDRFSSIQVERGCRAKHNQTKEYQRL